MSRFDLQNPIDFARLTNGSLAELISDFAGRDPSEWDILQGSYNGVLFHIFEKKTEYQAGMASIKGTGGRRKVKYSFPYMDGQTTDDLGRKPQMTEVEILLHGQRYMQGYIKLMAEFNKPTPGTLVHPVLGNSVVAVEDVQEVHNSEKRQAVLLHVTFTEHNFTIGDIRKLKDASVKGALTSALDAFQKIDGMISAVDATLAFGRSVKNQIKQALAEYKYRFGVTLSGMNITFNNGSSADIPSLVPVNRGGSRGSDGSVTDQLFIGVRSISDPFNAVPVSELSNNTATAVTASNLTKQVIDLRTSLSSIIQSIYHNGGALDLNDNILDMKQTAVLMQDVLEKGIASSQTQIIAYTTPRLMSLREVAFAAGVSVSRVQDLDTLNPSLESVNYIPAGTLLKVPTS